MDDRVDLTIARTEDGDAVDLVLVGRLDSETCDDLQHAVDGELRRGMHAIRLDLDAVTFLSSAGIRGLFDVQRSVKAAGGSCLVSTASPTVRRVLDLTRLTPILMGAAAGGEQPTGRAALRRPVADIEARGVRLVALEQPPRGPLPAELIGAAVEAVSGRAPAHPRRTLPRSTFAFGLGGIADDAPPARRAGEFAALDGAVFHRPPHHHAAIDFVLPTGDLQAEADILSGLVWQGIPGGRCGFEPMADEPTILIDDLAVSLLSQTEADAIAVVVAAEVHGLVGAELIRPLAEVAGGDSPLAGRRDVAVRWLSFSREPVYARHTALVVGVCCRGAGRRLAAFVRPIPGHDASGHFHAVVFPYRPIRRGAVDLRTTVADLAASEPLAVMHLVADPQPVLGSGRSEFVRGAAWFAPLDVHLATAEAAR
ncbi:MAG: STAS domain-containing protein [Planctomycetia bacterium]|nr:STAS domain-containing protein [Planctomycetia bacterium]